MGAEVRRSLSQDEDRNPPWPRPGLDTLKEWLIEHSWFVRLRHMSAKSRQGRPQSPFTKGEAWIKPFFDFTLDQAAQRILIPSAKSDLL